MRGSPYLSLTILMRFQHILPLSAIHSAMPCSPYLSLTILMHFQHIRSLPASHSAMPASPNLSLTVLISHSTSPCHSFSPLRFPLAPCPAFSFSSPTLPLPAIPSLPCASLTRLAPHSGFPVPLPAIPSLPCASLSRLAPHSGFPVPLYLSLPFRLPPALPSRALPRILVFQSHSTSPCHSFSPLRFPHTPCPAFWFSSTTLPLPAIPSLPCASFNNLAPLSDRLGIDDVVATLILSSDETIADGRGKAKGHPIYMSLGNIHHEDRWKPYGHALIATLPECPAEYTSVDRLQIFQYVLRLVLQPLKYASHV
ncbi:unnamed protein product [Closterium sp. NIES-65]|nr:unnamed protein product [Closterium sp. NIES-65]